MASGSSGKGGSRGGSRIKNTTRARERVAQWNAAAAGAPF